MVSVLARKTARLFVTSPVIACLFVMHPMPASGEKEEGIVFWGFGLLRPQAGLDKDLAMRPRSGPSTYWAALRGGKFTVMRVEPMDQHSYKMSVAPNGRIIWEIDGWKGGSILRTMSYPDLKVREHPRARPPYRSGWIVLSPDGGTLAYEVRTPLDQQGRPVELDLEQQRLFYRDTSLCPTRSQIYCEDLDTGKCRILMGNWFVVRHLRWSPDAKKVAFYAGHLSLGEKYETRLYVADVATGAYKRLSERSKFVGCKGIQERGYLSMEWPPVWSRNGDAVFFCARYGDDPDYGLIYRVDVRGGSKPVGVSPGQCLGTTPDDQGIYVHRRARQLGHVCLLSLDGKEPERELLTLPLVCEPIISPSGKWVAYHDGLSAIIVRNLHGTPLEMTLPGIGDTSGPVRATASSFFWVDRALSSSPDLRH